jgi:hypothetical protein
VIWNFFGNLKRFRRVYVVSQWLEDQGYRCKVQWSKRFAIKDGRFLFGEVSPSGEADVGM